MKIAKTVFGFRSSGPCPSRRAGPSFRGSAFGFRSLEVPGPLFCAKTAKTVFGLRALAPPAGPGQAFGIRPSALTFGFRRYPDHFLGENGQNGFRSSGPCPSRRAGPSFRDSALGFRSSEMPGPFFLRKRQKRFSVFGLRAPAPPAGPGQAFGIRPSAFGLRRCPGHFFWKIKMTKTVFGFRSSGPCPSRCPEHPRLKKIKCTIEKNKFQVSIET